MSSNGISLNDKTVVLAGPFGLLTQSLTQSFTESGADVALLTDDIKNAQRFCQNITDLREMSERYGRAAALQMHVTNEKEAEIEFGRCAELFGTTDIYIDTHLYSANIPFFRSDRSKEANAEVTELLTSNMQKILHMSGAAMSFLKGRSKTRVIYVFNELDQLALHKTNSDVLLELIQHVKKFAADTIKDNITFNAVAVGVNEEFLLKRFVKSPSIQSSLREIQQHLPQARLVDNREIANVLTFLASPLSAAINGQVLYLNHGLIAE